MSNYLGSEFKKLGFGFMRLPMLEGNVLDIDQVNNMVDHYMSKGFTYFDTAYVYHDGKSEEYLKQALVDRYPRESFQVATKLPMGHVKEPADMEKIFTTSLTRAGLEYVDFYLLHALNVGNVKMSDEMNAWDYMKSLKADGRAKHIGFSFHDNPEVLDEILTNHPEMEFVQLQINYIDWDSNDVKSRLCYEVAMKHNKPVIIMEPIKGGTLAAVTPEAQKEFETFAPEKSVASWAIRYAASLDNIITVLSGMSNMEQLTDNVGYMDEFVKLNDEEYKVVDKVVDIINQIPVVPCTDCKYCVAGCPMEIKIPKIFNIFNYHKKFDADQNVPSNKWQYNNQIQNKASTCIGCGACEAICPQHINIIKELAEVASLYE